MSDQDDTLLDEDLGDEEYDLGNDEEEALLADDYEIDRQNSYKGEEETDDVLDLGVTDALDDLEGEDENIEYRGQACYTDGNYYPQNEHPNYNEEDHQHYEASALSRNDSSIPKGDLREKLLKNAQRDVFIGNGQAIEEDDGEEAKERRNRFQNERIMITPKKNSDIPDSLENVITSDHGRPQFRGRGRGRSGRGGGGSTRGGRFLPHNPLNFNPRFRGPSYEEQQQQMPQFRPPLIEARPPLFPAGPPNPNNLMNPQLIYTTQRFQQFPQQCPPHFNDPGLRPIFNQFSQVPRLPNIRLEFRPRLAGPRFNGPLNQPQFLPSQAQHFQAPRPPIHPEGPGRPINHEQMMQNQGSSLLGPVPHQMGHPLGNQAGLPGPNHPNGPVSGQLPFENRPIFPDQRHFEAERRNLYDPRPPYNQQGVVNQQQQQQQQQPQQQQFNAIPIPIPPQPVPPVLNVPIQSGHKILINPHFRGTPQPSAEGRPLWENAQQSQSQTPGESFARPAGYQDRGSYNSSSSSQHNSQKNFAPSKNDDPYNYFSDVWQENKSSKTRGVSPAKNYMDERDKERDRERERDRDRDRDNYKDYDMKYKPGGRENYQDHRDRTPPPRARDYPQRSRPHQSNNSYNDSYDSRSNRSVNSSSRGPAKALQKRTPEPNERSEREISPKRSKTNPQNKSQKSNSEEKSHEEDVDPEMREYRKKMEEQKRLRAKILQEKENRRKQAAMEKQGDESKDLKSSDENKQENKSGGGTKDSAPVSNQLTGRVKNRTTDLPVSEAGEKLSSTTTATTTTPSPPKASSVRIIRTKQLPEKTNHIKESLEVNKPVDEQTKIVQQSNVRRVVISKPLGSVQKVATSIQKTISNLQKSASTPAVSNKNILNKSAVQNKSALLSNNSTTVLSKNPPSGGRIVVKDSTGPIRKVVINKTTVSVNKKQSQVNTNSQRIVLPVNSKPNTIIIDNLAASTTENQIRRMCQGIGTVENIEMGEGTATIVFKTHSAAAVFHKKYQRKMIDLSMINVQLVSPINQLTHSLVKK